ncbi:MAG: hypothetical protein ACLFQV_04890 [Vulcanimicrobiota bacterium]
MDTFLTDEEKEKRNFLLVKLEEQQEKQEEQQEQQLPAEMPEEQTEIKKQPEPVVVNIAQMARDKFTRVGDLKIEMDRDLSEEDYLDSPVFELIQVFKRYIDLQATQKELKDSFEQGMNLLKEDVKKISLEAEEKKPVEEFRATSLKLADFMKDIYGKWGSEELMFLLKSKSVELEKLNNDYLKLRKKCSKPACKKNGNQEVIEAICEKIDEAEYKTATYKTLETRTGEYLSGMIDEDAYYNTIEELWEIMESTRKSYEGVYISSQQITNEIAMGDNLLREGLEGWLDALNYIIESIQLMDEEGVQQGLQMAFESNKKLVTQQHLSRYSKKQEEMVTNFPGKQFFKNQPW